MSPPRASRLDDQRRVRVTDHSETVFMPPTHNYAIPRRDWDRIKRIASQEPPSHAWVENAYWALISQVPTMIAGAAGTQGWLQTLFLVGCAACLLGFLLCRQFWSMTLDNAGRFTNTLLQELEEIEAHFPSEAEDAEVPDTGGETESGSTEDPAPR